MSLLSAEPGRSEPRGGGFRRVAALARAEAVLLRRSPAAMGGALAAPVGLALLPLSNSASTGAASGSGIGAVLVIALAGFSLIMGVYYPLVTTLVARREEQVLKRLRAGELSDLEIIVATATPAATIAVIQIGLGALVAGLFLDLAAPVNPVLVLVALLLGVGVCVGLAAAVTTVTNSVEMAQLTATPLLLVSISFSGAMFPLDLMPASVHEAARMLPLTPVVELLRLGLTGQPDAGPTLGPVGAGLAAIGPLLVVTAWGALALAIVRRWFRWEPRR